MAKPTVYLDTNILSALFLRDRGISARHRQLATREWWQQERTHFDIFASVFTESELSRGHFAGQTKAIKACRRLKYLPMRRTVQECAGVFVKEGLIPPTKQGDAIQLALATVYEVDYLLTWNYAHLANVEVQRKLSELAARHRWTTTTLVSPENIPKEALGQSIRRKDR
jgi:predicted nucleic acid-binding protein